MKQIVPSASSSLHKEVATLALHHLRQKWERYKAKAPDVAGFVDNILLQIAEQISTFSTAGLVNSHNDICNANWLFASDGNIYLEVISKTHVTLRERFCATEESRTFGVRDPSLRSG